MKVRNHLKLKLIFSSFRRSFSTDIYWFHATDHPVANSLYNLDLNHPPKKFTPFSKGDSYRIESIYNHLIKGDKIENYQILVKEDGLFIADIEKLQLAPTYWNGPIYEIRRGQWFYDNSSSSPRPCETNLASILDEGYERITSEEKDSIEIDVTAAIESEQMSDEKKSVSRKLKFTKNELDQPVLISETSMMFDMTGTSVTKIKRGGFELKEEKPAAKKNPVTNSASNSASNFMSSSPESFLKSILSSKENESKLESQMEHDYHQDKTKLEENPLREVDHLILCIHGIGQKLSQKMESISFVHDVNLLRKAFKTASGKENSRIQVLPVLWRYDVPFAMTRGQLKGKAGDKRKENDGAEKSSFGAGKPSSNGSHLNVSLRDITINGILPVRNIIGDVVLDVLLYAEPRYKSRILDNVTLQMNQIVRKFIKLNQCKTPLKISVIGHSLGSVIAFDLLSSRDTKGRVMTDNIPASQKQLEFSVRDFFMLGSPLGLYQLVHGQGLTNDRLERNITCLYNIYHPADPISYRIEPLIDYRAAEIEPVAVPYSKGGITSGIQKISQNATSFWKTLANYYKQVEEQEKEKITGKNEFEEDFEAENELNFPSSTHPLKPDEIDQIKQKLFNLNPFNSRLDFALQEGFLDISLIAALASHMSYFENDDATKFIYNELKRK